VSADEGTGQEVRLIPAAPERRLYFLARCAMIST